MPIHPRGGGVRLGAAAGLVNIRTERALRIVLLLADAAGTDPEAWVHSRTLASRLGMPAKDLERAVTDLRGAGLVDSHRGRSGGYRLARAPEAITVADVVLALDYGPLRRSRPRPAEPASAVAAAAALDRVWRLAEREVVAMLDTVTLADIVAGRVPEAP